MQRLLVGSGLYAMLIRCMLAHATVENEGHAEMHVPP